MNSPSHYYLLIDDNQQGPYTLNQVRSMWNAGTVNLSTPFCQPGWNEWRSLEEIVEQIEPKAPPAPEPPVYGLSSPAPQMYFQAPPPLIHPPISRGVYCAFAVLFGALGLHHLYAREYAFGVLQLLVCLTLCWTIIVPLVFWFAALVQIFTVSEDAYGVKMV